MIDVEEYHLPIMQIISLGLLNKVVQTVYLMFNATPGKPG